MFKKFPNSTRKFIRLEKARIRRDILDPKKQDEMIKEIYNKLLNKQPGQENIKKPEVKKKEKPLGRSSQPLAYERGQTGEAKIEKTKKKKK